MSGADRGRPAPRRRCPRWQSRRFLSAITQVPCRTASLRLVSVRSRHLRHHTTPNVWSVGAARRAAGAQAGAHPDQGRPCDLRLALGRDEEGRREELPQREGSPQVQTTRPPPPPPLVPTLPPSHTLQAHLSRQATKEGGEDTRRREGKEAGSVPVLRQGVVWVGSG
eukprot:2758334-Rhodomonas_salina.2